jgi:hypothetical protein
MISRKAWIRDTPTTEQKNSPKGKPKEFQGTG